jgi:hypothetical protein
MPSKRNLKGTMTPRKRNCVSIFIRDRGTADGRCGADLAY